MKGVVGNLLRSKGRLEKAGFLTFWALPHLAELLKEKKKIQNKKPNKKEEKKRKKQKT